ncbi:hypothetical protein [Kitasatospora sp. NPDC087314]|uniref:hypothetical protein n=1 Tax=Kitasatospora sp. NPDC087314 TaxID=3364068 RepID=UPI0037F53449
MHNPHDDVAVTRRLDALTGQGRLVLRPSPGGTALDIARNALEACGKSPGDISSRLAGDAAWMTAAAWVRAGRIDHLLVDRAHRLTTSHTVKVIELATRTGADLWLIWSGPKALDKIARQLEAAGRHPAHLPLNAFYRHMPFPDPARTAPRQPDEDAGQPVTAWPRLPMTDFPLFLAVCRRHLPGEIFDALALVFHQQARHTRTWLRSNARGSLTGYLRDVRLGTAPTGEDALIRLRAIQSALFLAGGHLSWQPALLGPDPAARLLTRLDHRTASTLRTVTDTTAAAATALALYFSSAPIGFDMIRYRDIAPDGSTFHLPLLKDPTDPLPGLWTGTSTHDHYTPSSNSAGLRTRYPIQMPAPVWPVLAAHLAYRQAQGAGPDDPYFIHPHQPGRISPERSLRECVVRTSHRLHLSPGWLHRSHCRHGDQLAQHPDGWLTDRALGRGHIPTQEQPWSATW